PVRWTIPERETLLVLEGEARIEIAGGPTLELKRGDIASLPAGSETTWHLTTPFKEFWVIQRGACAPAGSARGGRPCSLRDRTRRPGPLACDGMIAAPGASQGDWTR